MDYEVAKGDNPQIITRADFVESNRPITKEVKNKKNSKRRGNGRGMIRYRKNSSNPYMAMVCVGTYIDSNNRSQCKYKSIGSFHLKIEAEKALAEYFRCPYDLNSIIVTFSDLYEVWFEDYKSKVTSKSYLRSIESVYKYCSGLYNMKILDIGAGHIKDAMYHGYIIESKGKNKGKRKYASDCTKERIKSLCNLMFDYALERKLILNNPARSFKVNDLLEKIEMNKKVKKSFNDNQVKEMWENVGIIKNIDMILVGIYTGFRPQELCLLEVRNVNLEKGYIRGGMKTVNGNNRVVPIHPLIMDIIKKRYYESINEYSGIYLFNNTTSRGKGAITYNSYRHIFDGIMKELDLEGYSPHCTRVTFATNAELCDLRPRAIKLILGHSQRYDVTNAVYIRTGLDYLENEMKKYRFKGDDNYG